MFFVYDGDWVYSVDGGLMSQEMYTRVTDSKIGDVVSEILDKEQGFWRLEQGGKEEEKAANLNRIWDMRQWVSSLYSSAYHADYQSFRKDIFEVEEPFRNDLMQAASDNPLYQKLMGVKYIVTEGKGKSGKEDGDKKEIAGYELYREKSGSQIKRG